MSPSGSAVGFVRVLGRTDCLALAFGAIIGWSWVLLTGTWIVTAGWGGAVLAFCIGGLAMVFIGLTYAELASAMPLAGGEHVYSLRALGRGASFICTWALLLAYATVVAFEAVALAVALDYLFPGIRVGGLWSVAGEPVDVTTVAIGIVGAVAMTTINVLGVKPSAVLQTAVTIVILLAGLSLVSGAVVSGTSTNLLPVFSGGAAGTLSVLIMVPMMFIGFDVIPQAAEEIRLPYRLIGTLLVISVLMALVWYLAMIMGVAVSLDPDTLRQAKMPTADASQANWASPWAARFMVLGGIAGILTSWNAFLVGGSRVLYALAHSRMLPGWLADIHPRYRTPYKAVMLLGGLALISPLFGRQVLIWLIDAGGFAVLIAYGMVAWSYLVLHRREPEMDRPYRAPLPMVTGIAALVLSVSIMLVYLPGSPAALIWPWEWGICIVWALAGALLYRGSGAG